MVPLLLGFLATGETCKPAELKGLTKRTELVMESQPYNPGTFLLPASVSHTQETVDLNVYYKG